MQRHKFFAAMLAAGTMLASGANAHPGSKLLIVGENERAAMGKGVTYEISQNVHLYRGAKKLAGGNKVSRHVNHRQIELNVEIDTPFRRIRRLCTQGFYSGDCSRSRRYTQGFWSGR